MIEHGEGAKLAHLHFAKHLEGHLHSRDAASRLTRS